MRRKCISCLSSESNIKKENEIRIKVRSTDSSVGPYVFIKEIGKGTFSSVLKVKRPDIPKCYFACKVINKKEIQENEDAKISLEREIRINHQLHHPGHVELVDLLSDENNYYMIMQYCPGGTLLEYIEKARNPIEENEVKPLFRQIIETLDYLQLMGISHRDLKPENILFNGSRKLVIADFGLSRFVYHQNRKNLVVTRCGSAEYASPEVLSGGKDPYDGFASDIWSCGIILYEMVTKRQPWKRSTQISSIIKQIINCDYEIPTNISNSCQDLLKKMLDPDPNKRITVPKILEHEWLRNVPKQFDVSKETVYNSISLKMIDKFFEVDDSLDEKSSIQNNNNIYRSFSKKNLIFDKQKLELENNFYNEELNHHHLYKGLRPAKIKVTKAPCINSNQKSTSSHYYHQAHGTPLSKKSQNSPQNVNQSLLGIEKIHIVKPPEINKSTFGARGRQFKPHLLKPKQKSSVELKEKELSIGSSDIVVMPPKPPSNNQRSPRSHRRPIGQKSQNG